MIEGLALFALKEAASYATVAYGAKIGAEWKIKAALKNRLNTEELKHLPLSHKLISILTPSAGEAKEPVDCSLPESVDELIEKGPLAFPAAFVQAANEKLLGELLHTGEKTFEQAMFVWAQAKLQGKDLPCNLITKELADICRPLQQGGIGATIAKILEWAGKDAGDLAAGSVLKALRARLDTDPQKFFDNLILDYPPTGRNAEGPRSDAKDTFVREKIALLKVLKSPEIQGTLAATVISWLIESQNQAEGTDCRINLEQWYDKQVGDISPENPNLAPAAKKLTDQIIERLKAATPTEGVVRVAMDDRILTDAKEEGEYIAVFTAGTVAFLMRENNLEKLIRATVIHAFNRIEKSPEKCGHTFMLERVERLISALRNSNEKESPFTLEEEEVTELCVGLFADETEGLPLPPPLKGIIRTLLSNPVVQPILKGVISTQAEGLTDAVLDQLLFSLAVPGKAAEKSEAAWAPSDQDRRVAQTIFNSVLHKPPMVLKKFSPKIVRQIDTLDGIPFLGSFVKGKLVDGLAAVIGRTVHTQGIKDGQPLSQSIYKLIDDMKESKEKEEDDRPDPSKDVLKEADPLTKKYANKKQSIAPAEMRVIRKELSDQIDQVAPEALLLVLQIARKRRHEEIVLQVRTRLQKMAADNIAEAEYRETYWTGNMIDRTSLISALFSALAAQLIRLVVAILSLPMTLFYGSFSGFYRAVEKGNIRRYQARKRRTYVEKVTDSIDTLRRQVLKTDALKKCTLTFARDLKENLV